MFPPTILMDKQYPPPRPGGEPAPDGTDPAEAKTRALRLIGTRPVSRDELYKKLIAKGTSEPDARCAVSWLSDMKYIDDADYAALVAKHYTKKGYGPARVRAELFRRGLERELAEEITAELPDQSEMLEELLRKKLKRCGPGTKDIRRAASAMAARGFSGDDIRAALKKLEREDPEE